MSNHPQKYPCVLVHKACDCSMRYFVQKDLNPNGARPCLAYVTEQHYWVEDDIKVGLLVSSVSTLYIH